MGLRLSSFTASACAIIEEENGWREGKREKGKGKTLEWLLFAQCEQAVQASLFSTPLLDRALPGRHHDRHRVQSYLAILRDGILRFC